MRCIIDGNSNMNVQGIATRIIPITHFKLEHILIDTFSHLNKSVIDYYGMVGLEFVKLWLLDKEKYKRRFYSNVEEYRTSAENKIPSCK